jgi:spore maturation protein CgeB
MLCWRKRATGFRRDARLVGEEQVFGVMRVTYVGTKTGTSLHRAMALDRLGHEVSIVDPFVDLAPSRWALRWVYHTGGIGAGLYAYASIRRRIAETDPDLIWVDHGAALGPALICSLRVLGAPIVNYMVDNAWCQLYRYRSRHYRSALKHYDLVVELRKSNIPAAQEAGARRTFLASLSADEIAHRPRDLSEDQRKKYEGDVAFIGTWLPERGPFLACLVRRGVSLSIWGSNWSKAPEWMILAPYWRGPALNGADDYAAAVQSAKICLGLLSKQTGDDYTSRSLEIPAIGGLFCGERTDKHLELYKEGVEAVFWDNAEECAEICHSLLRDEPLRTDIARRGRQRALSNGHFNEAELAKILDEVARI